METSMTEMELKDLEKANGGTFTPNKYATDEYENAGIECITHFIAKDEFWWNGEDIGFENADTVMYFFEKNGFAPASLEQAVSFRRRHMTRK